MYDADVYGDCFLFISTAAEPIRNYAGS